MTEKLKIGQKVVIKRKNGLPPIKGKVEGFTEGGIIVDGTEVSFETIEIIRKNLFGNP